MRQHIAHDPTTAEYAGALEGVWSDWEPSLRQLERLLRGGAAALSEQDEIVDLLRNAQYHAHTAGEFAAGLRAPLPATDAHDYLVSVFQACRDTLGVLAVRAELDELDEATAEIGLHSVLTTREAFQAARYSSVTAYRFAETMEPMYIQTYRSDEPQVMNTVLWGLVAVCAVLFTVLLFEVFLLTPTA